MQQNPIWEFVNGIAAVIPFYDCGDCCSCPDELGMAHNCLEVAYSRLGSWNSRRDKTTSASSLSWSSTEYKSHAWDILNYLQLSCTAEQRVIMKIY